MAVSLRGIAQLLGEKRFCPQKKPVAPFSVCCNPATTKLSSGFARIKTLLFISVLDFGRRSDKLVSKTWSSKSRVASGLYKQKGPQKTSLNSRALHRHAQRTTNKNPGASFALCNHWIFLPRPTRIEIVLLSAYDGTAVGLQQCSGRPVMMPRPTRYTRQCTCLCAVAKRVRSGGEGQQLLHSGRS